MFGKKSPVTIEIKPTSISDLKKEIRILIIDDNESDLISVLKEHQWKVVHKLDLENIDDVDLKDAHILLVDVRGVGKKLGFNDEGLGLSVFLKERFPEKKIVLYSTIAEHNSFHKAFRMCDKVLYKDGSKIPFITTIEELSAEIGDWNPMIKRLYQSLIEANKIDMSLDSFNTKMKALVSGGKKDKVSVEMALGVATNIASIIGSAIGAYSSLSGTK